MISYRKAYLCMLASILLSSVAQLSMKISMLMLSEQLEQGTLLIHLWHEYPILIWLIIGIGSYAISLIFWLFAISRLDLSLAYPMLSLSYVLVYFVAINWPLLGEESSWARSIGIFIILFGVTLITQSNQRGISHTQDFKSTNKKQDNND